MLSTISSMVNVALNEGIDRS